MLAHRPDLVGPFLGWSAALAGAGALGVRRHEIAALRASWHCGSDYEWGNHARYGIEAGLSDDDLDALGRLDGADRFGDPTDRLVIRLVDEIMEGGATPSREHLAAELGPAALVDLVWTVGHYVGLSLVARVLALPQGDLRYAPPRPDR